MGIINTMRTAAWILLAGLCVGLGARAQARDIDLAALARQSMNYLLYTPRPSLDYECQFLIYPLAVPPSRLGQAGSTTGDVITDNQSGARAIAGTAHAPITWGDTDARMDVVFPYMREMSGSTEGQDVEIGLHRRVRGYMRDDGLCWLASGGLFRPGRDYALAWTNGLLMIRLIENWQRTGNLQDKALARKLFEGIRRIATRRDGRAWHEGGMMPWADGVWLHEYGPKGWTRQPGITWPVTVYWKATRDPEALAFARELAEGVLHNSQPGLGVHAFNPDGSFQGGNTHLVLHEVLGVAELGAATGDARLVSFARRVYEYVRSLGMDWGWFPEYRVHYLGDGDRHLPGGGGRARLLGSRRALRAQLPAACPLPGVGGMGAHRAGLQSRRLAGEDERVHDRHAAPGWQLSGLHRAGQRPGAVPPLAI